MDFYIRNNMDLTKLPPPPKGQQGVTFQSFQHLPPPPPGQKGMTLDEIKGNRQPVQLPTSPKPDYMGEISGAVKGLANQAIQPVQNVVDRAGQQSTFSNALQGASAGVQGAANVAGGAIGSGLNTLTGGFAEKVGGLLSAGVSKVIDSIPDQYKQTAMDMIQKHPELANNAGAIANLAATFMGGGVANKVSGKIGDVVGSKLVSKVGSKIASATKSTLGKLPTRGVKTGIQPSEIFNTKNKITKNIADKISPKSTVKEARLATVEGRFVQGKEPTLFRAGKEDTILPSKKTLQAVETIKRLIPNANKLNETKLYTASDKKVSEIATKLKPEMQKAKLNKETIEKVNSDLEKLQKKQLSNADASDEVNVKKRQSQFQDRLERIYGGGVSKTIEQGKKEGWNGARLQEEIQKKVSKQENANLNDLWEERISYDNSVPDNVKRANELSDASLLNKKEEWLQNREILNDAINSNKNGLGEKSRSAFSDMTDLYTAKTGIISKAKVNKTIKPSKIKQFTENNPYLVKGSLIGAGYLLGKKGGLLP
jgi:hypothetical protein